MSKGNISMTTKLEEYRGIEKILIERKEEVVVKIESLLLEFVDMFDGSHDSLMGSQVFINGQQLLESSLHYIEKRIEHVSEIIEQEESLLKTKQREEYESNINKKNT